MADKESAFKSAFKIAAKRTDAELEKPVSVIQAFVGLAMRDGSLAAEARGMVKGLGDAVYAGYGLNDHHRELGGALEPMASDIADAREFYHNAPPLIAPKKPELDGGKTVTAHGVAEQNNEQKSSVHDSEKGTAKPREDGKVDFGTWKDRVAERREQAQQERETTRESQKERQSQEQGREAGRDR